MAREIQATQSFGDIHLPKSVTRHGSTQRDRIIARLRAVRRVTLVLSFGVGAVFTGLALRHSTQPATAAPAQAVQTASQPPSTQGQVGNVPSQSLFDNQNSGNFSVAPAASRSVSRMRTVSS